MPVATPPPVTEAEAPPDASAPSIDRAKATKKRPKRQPPYAVILHNDDKNTMEFVVGVLRKVFGFGATKATWLMMRVHVGGKAPVWTGTRELAELKAEQVKSCGADPLMASQGAQPLSVSVEPLPG